MWRKTPILVSVFTIDLPWRRRDEFRRFFSIGSGRSGSATHIGYTGETTRSS